MSEPTSLSRRNALKWLAGTAAAPAALIAAPNETEPAPAAYPTRYSFHDPDFSKPVTGPWERLLTAEELAVITVLADLILPKDENGPAASEIGVPDFINEWISAPYDDQRESREVIRGGIAWLNTESFRRHGKGVTELSVGQQTELLDDIAAQPVKTEHRIGGLFFKEFRQLCLGGYYTHSATWKHLGYIGNVSIGGPYPGVPPEVIKQYGLEDVA
ncbi:MAG: gluconate 2-dehydrogenase subunit 3 family protein [Prosthecobacter sp.]|nr:gluconate 2-dehydrogenase subunit 3 family protein [Prosthecobacter sp.]